MKRLLTLAGVACALFLVVGCGAAATVVTSAPAASAVQPVIPPTAAPTEPPTEAPTPASGVGSTWTITDGSGNSVDITLTKITDPERANTYSAAPPGAHYIAAFFTIKGDTGIFDSDVYDDAGGISNTGATVAADIAELDCDSDFSGSGEYTVTPGHTITGCVPFEVLNGQWLTDITWDASGGNGADWSGHF